MHASVVLSGFVQEEYTKPGTGIGKGGTLHFVTMKITESAAMM